VEAPDDTIVARGTPEGTGAVAVIRLSGPEAGPLLERVTRGVRADPVRTPRRMIRGWVVDESGRDLDEVLMVFMPGPGSYTGEDMAEIHCHGGEAVVAVIVGELMRAGARGALRGEFTRRALENGKLDLTRAEAVNRLIRAASREQVTGASRLLGGEVEALARQVSEELHQALAHLEAGLDFCEEPETAGMTPQGLERIVMDVRKLRDSVRRVAQEELEVVVAGRPNVGKSSLVNALAKRPVSIVTGEPGTTRDAVRAAVTLNGARVDLVDTAGRGYVEATTQAAREAERVAREKVKRAGFVIWVTDKPTDDVPPDIECAPASLFVVNKADLMEASQRAAAEGDGRLRVSAKTGQGIERLAEELGRRLIEEYGPADGIPLTSRQEDALHRIQKGAETAISALENLQPELGAEDLKDALGGVSDLLGEGVDVDVLDRIFSEFCIGK
jgi:tRNA modification GTPase